MPIQTPRHRQIVAVPVVLAALLAMLVVSEDTSVALLAPRDATSYLEASDEGAMLAGEGFVASLRPGARARTAQNGMLEVDHGDVLLQAQGYGTAMLGEVRVHMFLGSVFLMRHADAITVAALDVPVLVSHASFSAPVLLPPRHQVRIADDAESIPATQRIPDIWLDERMRDAAMLRHETAAAPTLLHEDAAMTAPFGAIGLDDDGQFLSLLSRREPLTSSEASLVLAVAKRMHATLPLDGLLALTLSMHVHHEGVASLLTDAVASSSSRIPDWPLAAASTVRVMHRPPDSSFVRLWERMAKREAVRDPAHAMRLPLLAEDLAAHMDTLGYPQSAGLWRESGHTLRRFLAALLGDTALHDVSAHTSHGTAPPPPEPETSSLRLDPDDARTIAYDAFRDAGALFSVDTSFDPIPPSFRMVRVTGVLFPSSRGLVSISGDYDAVTGVLHRIERDGGRLPNALPLDTFFLTL